MVDFKDKDFGAFEVWVNGSSLDLVVESHTVYEGPITTFMSAVDTYQKLKEYFKGTEHE